MTDDKAGPQIPEELWAIHNEEAGFNGSAGRDDHDIQCFSTRHEANMEAISPAGHIWTPTLVGVHPRHRDECEKLRARVAELEAVLEPLLIEIEPLRHAQNQETNRLVEEKRSWAQEHNARRPNDAEPWVFLDQYRDGLERQWEPLNIAVRAANEAFDRRLPDAGTEESSPP